MSHQCYTAYTLILWRFLPPSRVIFVDTASGNPRGIFNRTCDSAVGETAINLFPSVLFLNFPRAFFLVELGLTKNPPWVRVTCPSSLSFSTKGGQRKLDSSK